MGLILLRICKEYELGYAQFWMILRAQLVYGTDFNGRDFLVKSKKWAVGQPESALSVDDIAMFAD